uniref:Choline transporter-like protein n=2 Tax=Odontella aurita TaxID=265563 RepID=A0A7S4NC07_9STRA|mmetsp:Transcript_579/g.1792  ORF Transcript_579/g.1792 Transcript_579/m.1792 type:complete len:486 (+) Transcript_579:231-1688(+)
MFGESQQQGGIPVVQGVAVPAQPQQYTKPGSHATGFNEPLTIGSGTIEFNGVKGENQPKHFQDVAFAVAFWAHIAVMLYFLVTYAGAANGNGNENGYEYSGVIYCCMTCGVFAVGLSTVALGFMMSCATQLIKMALFFSIGLSLAVGVLGAMSGQILLAGMGFLSCAFGCCYAYFVWARIPFAATNLNTALSAVKSNMGLAVVAYFFLFVAFGWSIWWSVAAGGAMNYMGTGALFLFLVSYYWTHQVIQNTVHVTTAGVVGTWWHVPEEASSCCSSAIKDSFIRATTYSFGSICFGSLLVALIQALRSLQHALRDNEDFNFLVCIVDCILGCMEAIIEYLNKWAYIYVGLYGYSYLEAGKNVITLFQNKGWSAIITDNLIDNVLLMMSVAIGLLTGLIGLLLAVLDNNLFAGIGIDDGGSVGFFVGFLVGYVLASILMSVVGSAVNTVIVCFAEAPAEFQQNHPQLSDEMRFAWTQAWPVECGSL